MEVGVRFEGIVKFTVRDDNGEVVSTETNSVTNYLMNAFTQWLTGTSNGKLLPPSWIGAGTGTGTASPSDIALWTPLDGTLKACDLVLITRGYYAEFNVTYQTTDPLGSYSEFGLFDSAGNMWAHVTSNQVKDAGQTLTVQWMIQMVADNTNTNATVTNQVRQAFAQWMTGVPNIAGLDGAFPHPTKIKLGKGTGTPAVVDTSLWNPVEPSASTVGSSTAASNGAKFASTYKSGIDNGGTWGGISSMKWSDI